ncbi:MAG TPA: hypothetical protein VM779_01055 [Thermoanaerobaculia bacterium]|nr:hypothetical protein [Thermoanaerobaculia bacterium]
MLRKLNFTERLKIPSSAIRIELRRADDGTLSFDAKLDLAALRVASDARVLIEAQYRTSYMRFDCGPIGALAIPEDRRLTEIDSDRIVRFRIKVVDPARGARRILAASNDITVSCDEGASASRIALLPVNFDDLGDQVWRIHYEAGQPVLELNTRIDSIERLARHDPAFFALVYPAAVREILTHFLLVERWDENDEGDDAPELWVRWARQMIADPVPADRDEREAWIEEVVVAFCGQHRTADKMRLGEENA